MAGNLIRFAHREDDRGSIVMALLLIMVGSMMAALLVPTILIQLNTTRVDTRRDHALQAASAGMDDVIGRIRTATDDTGHGAIAKLPCTLSTQVTDVVAPGGTQAYRVNVYYFVSNPRGHDDWLKDPTKQITCAQGNGTKVTPAFAVVVSEGTDAGPSNFASGTRVMQATYNFDTDYTDIPGGLIHSYGSSPDLCLDAGSSSPPVGTIVKFASCASGSDRQTWSYDANLTISLRSTATGTTRGLCLDAPLPHSAGQPVVLQPCLAKVPPEQQWSYDGNNNMPATSAAGAPETLCLVPQSPNTLSSNLILNPCGASDTGHALQPDASAGAGNAGASLQYLVSYRQFARCLAVTNQTLPSTDTTKFLVTSPCKITPNSTPTPLDRQWNFPAVASGAISASGTVTSVQDSTFCLTSPMSLGGYPYLVKCDPTLSATRQKWTVWADAGAYDQSYRISDASSGVSPTGIGYCLQPTDQAATPPDGYPVNGYNVSKVIVTTCSGTTLQKWNAPPGVQTTSVTDYHEV